jgi:hypothetical protein
MGRRMRAWCHAHVPIERLANSWDDVTCNDCLTAYRRTLINRFGYWWHFWFDQFQKVAGRR